MNKDLEHLLKMGWDNFKIRNRFGNQHYNNFMNSLNPYLIVLYELYENLIQKQNELEKSKSECEHYKTRYTEIAKILVTQKIELTKLGIKEGSYGA